jgi:hypothetical protein
MGTQRRQMTNKRTLKRWFQDPIKNADKIIESQLEWGADRCEYLAQHSSREDALSLYQEYEEWVNTDDGDDYGYLILEQIAAY